MGLDWGVYLRTRYIPRRYAAGLRYTAMISLLPLSKRSTGRGGLAINIIDASNTTLKFPKSFKGTAPINGTRA
jgi:hypothetical protein